MMTTDNAGGILKIFYIGTDPRQVKDVFTTSKRPKPKRGVLDVLVDPNDLLREQRIRRLMKRVAKLKQMAEAIVQP